MTRWCLIMLCFFATCLATRTTPRRPAATPAPVLDPSWPSQAQGYGRTVEAAKNDAAKFLLGKMTDMLTRQSPPLTSWRPTIAFVKREVFVGEGMPGDDVDLENIGRAKSWIYPVKAIDLAAFASLDEEAQRGQRRLDRITLTTRLFAGVTLLLALAAFYFRERRGASARRYARTV